MNKQEANKLIAGFMGLSTEKVWADCVAISEDGRELGGYVEPYFDYDYSWDSIMPVVEKIESLGNKFQICRRRIEIIKDKFKEGDGIFMVKEETKMQSVYKGVIQFIEWYNKQLK